MKENKCAARGADIERIRGYLALSCNKIPEIIFYGETDSTNTRAKEHALSGGAEAVFIAGRQSAGRGRRGRSFLSESGGIYVSFLCYPKDSSPADPTALTARAAVRLLSPIRRETRREPLIKWVNDIYIDGKKVAGILCEGEFDEKGKLRYYIIGMGINVYKNASLCAEVPIATTLEDVTERELDIDRLAADIITAFTSADTEDEAEILREYRERSLLLGRRVTVLGATESYPAVAESIGDDYSLTVRCESGERRRVYTGEVSVRAQEPEPVGKGGETNG